MHSYLRGSAQPLTAQYDVALLDLDGVVYIGADAVPGAAEALAAARDQGMGLAFVTNNASRPPWVVAEHLTELGISASPDEVITSAQAAARYLAEQLPPGARVLVVGTTGLTEALRERGLEPVSEAGDDVDGVVQGFSPDLGWRLLAEGAVAINRGVLWVATNMDPTVPSPRGRLPGNGSLVTALRHATGAEPVVTGKPDPAMHRESVLRSGAQRPLVVGDRLDTDIEGANEAGCDSLLVLTGVTDPAELLAARPNQRPTYLAADLAGLLVPHPEPRSSDGGVSVGGWRATAHAAAGGKWRLQLGRAQGEPTPGDRVREADGEGNQSGDGEGNQSRDGEGNHGDVDALRALCAALWGADAGDGSPSSVEPDRDATGAELVLARLGLA